MIVVRQVSCEGLTGKTSVKEIGDVGCRNVRGIYVNRDVVGGVSLGVCLCLYCQVNPIQSKVTGHVGSV